MNAQKARVIAKRNLQNKIKFQYEEIIERIKVRAYNGFVTLKYDDEEIEDNVVQLLVKDGFSVKQTQTDYGAESLIKW